MNAEQIARLAHADQLDRQGQPYIDHPARVAAAFPHGQCQDVAWLHDVLEDTATTPLVLYMAGVSRPVLDILQLLTRAHGINDVQYEAYIGRIVASGSECAIRVKLADLRDNLRPGGPPRNAERRYSGAIYRLERALAELGFTA